MRLSELLGRAVVSESGLRLGHVHEVRGELTDGRLRVTGLVAGKLGILERYGVGTHGSGGPTQAKVRGHPVIPWSASSASAARWSSGLSPRRVRDSAAEGSQSRTALPSLASTAAPPTSLSNRSAQCLRSTGIRNTRGSATTMTQATRSRHRSPAGEARNRRASCRPRRMLWGRVLMSTPDVHTRPPLPATVPCLSPRRSSLRRHAGPRRRPPRPGRWEARPPTTEACSWQPPPSRAAAA